MSTVEINGAQRVKSRPPPRTAAAAAAAKTAAGKAGWYVHVLAKKKQMETIQKLANTCTICFI